MTQALDELWALPLDSWERTHMLQALPDYRLPTTEEKMAALKEDGQEKEIARMTQSFVKQLESTVTQRERANAAQAFVHQFERRLARPLADAERATIRERYDSVGPVRLGDVVLDLKPAELSA